MRQMFSHDDLKRLFSGAAGVAVCGVLLGAAARPQLDNHPFTGPQILMPGGGARTSADAADVGTAAYQGHTPDYVVGTDWTRVAAAPSPPPSAGDDIEVTVLAADEAPQPAPAQAVWRDEPREPSAYPSLAGGAVYEANLPPPPPAPERLGDSDL